MIPIRDNIPSRTTPFVNYLIIAACSLVFLRQVQLGENQSELIYTYGMVPARVTQPDASIVIREPVLVQTRFGVQKAERERTLEPPGFTPWATLLSCIFLHGGFMHFIGNMWFLYIFGDNVEDRLGHIPYLIFYLGSGAAASAAHLWFNPASAVPTIGASGAIAGVMGAYMLLYPHGKVMSFVPIVIFLQMVVLPAPVFLGIWFLIQLYHGYVAATSAATGAGVAWWAHIGGFVVGLAACWILKTTGAARPPVLAVRPHTERSGTYRAPRRRGDFG